MADFSFDTSDFLRSLDWAKEEVRKGAERGMHDAVDKLVQVSSEIAPHDKGTLEKSWAKDVRWNGNTIVGEVAYSVKERDGNGDVFNYAAWTHEDPNYKYGPGTLAKPGAEGWSGRHYEPGRKYLERPLLGEAKAFYDHIAEEIKKEVGE
jgi:hypothetical protein